MIYLLDYSISKADVLAHLGYNNQEISDTLNQKIDACIALSYERIVPAFTYQIFSVHPSLHGIEIENTSLTIDSYDLKQLLCYSREAILLALTAGVGIEQAIRTQSYRDMTSCVILDSCASVATESIAEAFQQQIKQTLSEKNLSITNRFSCGYGDFSLRYQKDLLQLLHAEKKIGLYANEFGILQPKKSITAVIGIVDKQIRHRYYAACSNCAAKEDCAYQKEGKTCFNYMQD